MIKKRYISLLLVIVLMFTMNTVIFAEEISESTDSHRTGLILMTEEQLENFKANTPEITNVYLNKLAVERINAEQDGNVDLMSTLDWVEYGDEFETDVTPISMLSDTGENSYPTSVDNSKPDSDTHIKTFPGINDQEKMNSCAGWSVAYYMLTNNANRVRGKNVTASTTYSPNWIYNLGNNGIDKGMSIDIAMANLYHYGCTTLNDVPINKKNCLTWYPVSEKWKNAIYNKCVIMCEELNKGLSDTFITSNKSNALDNLKKLLACGYVVCISTYATNDVDYGYTSKNEKRAVWTSVNIQEDSHAMTIVGYDDEFKADVNRNGDFEEFEKGAFKLANSWGTDFGSSGYVWLSYDALNSVSAIKTNTDSKRVPAINDYMYYFAKPLVEYEPLLLANVKIETQRRNQLGIIIGVEDVLEPNFKYEQDMTEYSYTDFGREEQGLPFTYRGGNFNLAGETEKEEGEIVIDMTTLLSKYELQKGRKYNFYVKLNDNLEDYFKAGITGFELIDLRNNTTYSAELTGKKANNSTVTENIEYVSSIDTVKPDKKSFKLNFSNYILTDTISNSNIYIEDSENNKIETECTYAATPTKEIDLSVNENLNNGFYTMTISKELRSIGGNKMSEDVKQDFYVPFH